MESLHHTLSTVRRTLNRILPFATPGTPLWQDVVHTLALCALLYYAPKLLENRTEKYLQEETRRQREAPQVAADERARELDEGPEPQDDDDAEDDDLENGEDHEDNIIPEPAAANGFPPRPNEQPQPADAGPADAPNLPPAATARARQNIGTKKAKALARKDQRRAYNEFLRSQGEAQRSADAEGAAEREAAAEAARARRAEADRKIREQERKEREKRKAAEEEERMAEDRARRGCVEYVNGRLHRAGMCNVWDVVKEWPRKDEVWVEKILRLNGVLGDGMKKDEKGRVTMMTESGWIVRVDEEVMTEVWERAVVKAGGKGDGKIGMAEVGALIEEVLRDRADA